MFGLPASQWFGGSFNERLLFSGLEKKVVQIADVFLARIERREKSVGELRS